MSLGKGEVFVVFRNERKLFEKINRTEQDINNYNNNNYYYY